VKTILVLDDDREFRDLIVPALASRGHKVVQARTGGEALAEVQRSGVDLAVVDGLLPDTDGISWIAQLRSERPELPVVFVSAFWRDLASFNRLTKDLRVSLVLHKPVAPTLFVEEVENLLAGRATPPAPRRPDLAQAEQALRALSADYARGLPAKGRELAEAVRNLRHDPADQPSRAAAQMLAHRMRGTAGSYGFFAVGEAAGTIEDALPEALAPAASPEAWSALGAALEAFEAAVAAVGQPGEPEPGSGGSLTSGRLLAVSARPEFLDQVRALGRQQLYQVQCASTVAEASAAAVRAAPDAAFVDLALPEAARLARELRSLPGCEGVALAFLGEAAAGTPDRIAAAHAGASLFLARPVDAESLSSAARQLVAAAQVRRPRVLMVDDDEAFAKHTCHLLERRGFAIRHLAEPARLLEALEEAPPDLVLLDVALPGMSGFDLCRVLRATPRWQDLPVVMLTAQPGVQARIGAFQSGADDYLSKPVVEEELLARVQVRVERARLLRERYDKDALTGLLLRRPLVETLRARLLEASRHDRPLALAIIDFDRFKAVNDAHGHLAGDAVLAAFGKLVGRRFRAEDLRGRWGGEEFLLAFPGESRSTIQGALERLQAEFAQLDFKGDAGELFRVGFCVGIAGFPEDGQSLEELIRCADRRLYLGKRAGTGQVVAKG
jgi:diguanylate cyclase (GGDEF)-like protein